MEARFRPEVDTQRLPHSFADDSEIRKIDQKDQSDQGDHTHQTEQY
jgi:hypothetical protein